MKTKPIAPLLAMLASLAFTPGLVSAQTDTSAKTQIDEQANSKNNANSLDKDPSTASTGSADKADSKTPGSPLDKNPSTAPTDSADKSATKDINENEEGKKSDKLTDNAFLFKAAEGGLTEVELGKLAQEKGSSADVKQFGSHMVMDHSKANDELKAVAAEKGVTVPTTLDAKHQAIVDKFSKLSGNAFDEAYVPAMVKDHEKDAALFKEESTSGQDPTVKAFANKTLKVVETHLSDIKSIQKQIK